MLPTLYRCCIAAAAALASLTAAPVHGQERGRESARSTMSPRASARSSSLSDAIRRVQRSTGGRILGAERVPFDGRNINRIKYLDDRGRVRYIDEPAQDSPSSSDSRSDAAPASSSQHGDNR